MSDRSLTDADAAAIASELHKLHICRFDGVSVEDMLFIKDLLSLYKETRSEFIKWAVRGVVYGSLILISIFAYFKFSGTK